MRTTRLPALALMALLAAAGCNKSRPTGGSPGGPVTVPAGGPGGGTVTVSPSSCTSCHGDPARLSGATTNPLIASAPPKGLLGEQVGRPVGAHDKHLRDGLALALACANCHVMPTSASTHRPQAQQGKVTFSMVLPNADATWLALSTGTATWDGASCSATYCHGNFPGGRNATVSWQNGAATCGACHGTPPTAIRNGGTHPAASNCEGCHGSGYAAGSVSGLALATHVDGRVTLSGTGACDSCHGQPPVGATSLPGSSGSTHPPRSDCGSCHPGAVANQNAGPNHQDGTVNLVNLTCTSCHGTASRPNENGVGTFDPLQEAAPPVTASGGASGGAHLAHVNPAAAGQAYRPVACTECHLGAIPSGMLHANGTVTVAFGPTATLGGATPSYTGATPTCNATYCHGGTLPAGYGGSVTSWVWSGAAATCSSCHALPPASTAHTGIASSPTACAPCHGGTVNVDGTINVAGTLHLNGSLDVTGNVCTACHGDNSPSPRTNYSTAAPPRDHLGNIATSFRGVGAHATHLASDGRSLQVACADCHVTPGSGTNHNNGTPDVALSGRAGAGASYSAAGLTCSSTYCHGNFTGGNGTAATLAWNATAGLPLGCTACHGAPPPLNATVKHPQTGTTSCGLCHAGYSSSSVVRATHVDGTRDFPTGCTACHGDTTVANAANTNLAVAPGYAAGSIDSHGNTAVSARGVGAHQLHLTTALSTSVTCAQCHGTLPAAGNTAHADGGNPLLSWGSVATAGTPASVPTAVQAASVTCSSNWCHGGNVQLQGGTLTSNIPWNAASLPATTCASCHGNPPPLSAASHHPQNDGCASCHGAGYTKTSATAGTVTAATHVDGAILAATGCTACHGVLSGVGGAPVANSSPTVAPGFNGSAVDTRGNASGAAAGAHQAHLVAGTLRGPIACAECHGTLPAAGNTAHATGAGTGGARATLTWGSIANGSLDPWSGAVSPAYAGSNTATTDTAAGSCSSTYCHGNFRNGTTGNAPAWSATSAACGSCHGLPPAGTHPTLTAGAACSGCHTGYTGTQGGAIGTFGVNLAVHMDGHLDASGESAGGQNCSGCHSSTFQAMNGTVSKPFKHTLGNVVGTNDSPGVGTADWTTGAGLNSAVAAAGRSCANMCHGDHPHDLGATTTHQNNVYLDATTAALRGATATASTRAAVDHAPGSATNGLCISCHQRPLDTAAGRIAVTAASYNNTGHDYVTNTVGATTYSWQFTMHDGGVFQRNCTKCHAGGAGEDQATVGGTNLGAVHYSDNDSLLMGSSAAAGGTATVATFVCYKCHGTATTGPAFPMNRSGVDVYTDAQKVEGHGGAVAATQKNLNNSAHTTLTEATAAFGGTVFSGSGRHVSCLDCHDPHESGKTNLDRAATATSTRNRIPAGSPLTGATGVQYGTLAGAGKSYPALPAAGAWPATAAANYGDAVTRATYEYEICFKCHSGFAFGATPPAAAATPSGQAETDLGLEFSPSMRSGHPVVTGLTNYTGSPAPKALVAAQLIAPWNANMGAQTMTCTDCHNTDAASPAAQGPHGSAIPFMLAGARKAWPYTLASQNGGTTGTLFRLSTATSGTGNDRLFCMNCHPDPTTTNGLHTLGGIASGQHSGSTITECTDCHIRIPHGGKVSRLIVTTNAPARYKVGTPNFSSFTKGSTYTTYSIANIGSSCSRHAATRTEAW